VPAPAIAARAFRGEYRLARLAVARAATASGRAARA